MKIFAIIFADDESANDATAFLRAAARIAANASGVVDALIVGSNERAQLVQEVLGAGVRSLVVASHTSLVSPVQSEQLLAALLQALPKLREGEGDAPTLFLFSAGALGDELAVRAAVRTNGITLGRCIDISFAGGQFIAHRPAFGGRVNVQLQALGRLCFASVRPDRVAAKEASAGAPNDRTGELQDMPVHRLQLSEPLPAAQPIAYEAITGQMQRLETARLVVSGGRGMGGPQGFEQLGALAEALGGALGGSLPAVDAGWVSGASQVGQSGKYVTPVVYIAVGISGTLQHMAGIGPQTRIVAINNDPDADIFKEAQIGILADWRAIVALIVEHAVKGR